MVLQFGPALIVLYIPYQHPVLFIAGMLVTVLTLGASAAAVNYVMIKIINRDEVGLRDFKEGFRRFFGRGALAAVIAILGTLILWVDLLFSLNHSNQIIQLMSGIWIWGLVFWYAVLQFVFPFLVQQDIGLIKALKRAALVVIDNLLGSAIVVVVTLVVLVPALFWLPSLALCGELVGADPKLRTTRFCRSTIRQKKKLKRKPKYKEDKAWPNISLLPVALSPALARGITVASLGAAEEPGSDRKCVKT